ncbi:putative reverse transcriptase domain, reverse transcriptase zinc-binding domain protein [Tanacetum coccineum]
MKSLKKPLRKLLRDHENLHDRVVKLRHELDKFQKAIDLNPADSNLRDEEAVYVKAFTKAKIDEERFLKQKSIVKWLDVGDSNSAYFHKSFKSRNQMSRIEVIKDENNVEDSVGMDVCKAVHDFFQNGQLLKEINHTFIALTPKASSRWNHGPPRCAFKVDIQKAYDTVDWRLLDTILKCFGFHPTMVERIMACVSSTSFSLCLNGNVHGFFKGRRGVDPF